METFSPLQLARDVAPSRFTSEVDRICKERDVAALIAHLQKPDTDPVQVALEIDARVRFYGCEEDPGDKGDSGFNETLLVTAFRMLAAGSPPPKAES